jgi:pSer/pThr/pTyr-binding forkhead associated (FHA) protein
MTAHVSKHLVEQHLPIFAVDTEHGKHPPVAMDRPVCVIGRQYGVNLPLNAPQVSRFHAMIVRDPWRVYVRDLASINGLQRNGQAIHESQLSDDDELRIGGFTLRCASGFSAAAEETQAIESAHATTNTTGDATAAPPGELRVEERSFPLGSTQHTFLIGRRAQCDLSLAQEEVSPVHAVVFEMGGKRYIRDLNTSAGTYVNGETVHQTELHPGDVIRIGQTTIEYDCDVPATEHDLSAAEQASASVSDDASAENLPIPVVWADDEPAPNKSTPHETPPDPALAVAAATELPGANASSENPTAVPVELIPSAGVPVPADQAEAQATAEEEYVVSADELPASALPGATAASTVAAADVDASFTQPISLAADDEHRDGRADDAGDTMQITNLVDELADKASTLQEEWEKHTREEEDEEPSGAESDST